MPWICRDWGSLSWTKMSLPFLLKPNPFTKLRGEGVGVIFPTHRGKGFAAVLVTRSRVLFFSFFLNLELVWAMKKRSIKRSDIGNETYTRESLLGFLESTPFKHSEVPPTHKVKRNLPSKIWNIFITHDNMVMVNSGYKRKSSNKVLSKSFQYCIVL